MFDKAHQNAITWKEPMAAKQKYLLQPQETMENCSSITVSEGFKQYIWVIKVLHWTTPQVYVHYIKFSMLGPV
jgi:hypothetical protein